MSVLGVYVPGDSILHRTPAGAKMTGLAAFGVASAFAGTPTIGAALIALALIGYQVAGLGIGIAVRRLRPLLPVAVLVGVVQWVTGGWLAALGTATVLVALLMAATLVSLTTSTTAMVDALVTAIRPLRRLGVDPERVGLQLALGIRAVPLVLELARNIREAQRARGLSADPRAFAVPLIVRSLRQADQLADALHARGIDD